MTSTLIAVLEPSIVGAAWSCAVIVGVSPEFVSVKVDGVVATPFVNVAVCGLGIVGATPAFGVTRVVALELKTIVLLPVYVVSVLPDWSVAVRVTVNATFAVSVPECCVVTRKPDATKVTLAVAVSGVPPASALIVAVPTVFDRTVPVTCPLAFVGPPIGGWTKVSLPPRELESVTVTVRFAATFCQASRRVTVMVEVSMPFASTAVGAAAMLEVVALVAPVATLTLAPVQPMVVEVSVYVVAEPVPVVSWAQIVTGPSFLNSFTDGVPTPAAKATVVLEPKAMSVADASVTFGVVLSGALFAPLKTRVCVPV